MADLSVLSAAEWRLLHAVAARVVPETAGYDAAARAEFDGLVANALGLRPPAVRRQIGVLLKLVRLAPVLRYGRPFERLSEPQQNAFLAWLQDGPIPKLRVGFWGLKATIFLGHYGRASTAAKIGYTPSFDGNSRLAAGRGRS